MSTVNVRISRQTHQHVRELADLKGDSLQGILEKAVEEYRRRAFLERANEAFAALRNDPAAWRDESEERAAWDATLSIRPAGTNRRGPGPPSSCLWTRSTT